MQVTEAWIAIEISNDTVVIAYGPFDTNSEAMRFAAQYNSYLASARISRAGGQMVVRKLRRPPSPHL